MKTNEIYTLNLEVGEVDDLQTILMDKIKKDFKGVTGSQNDSEAHCVEVMNFRDTVGIYCKVAQIQADIAKEVHELLEG